jgi:hypothetical protein
MICDVPHLGQLFLLVAYALSEGLLPAQPKFVHVLCGIETRVGRVGLAAD